MKATLAPSNRTGIKAILRALISVLIFLPACSVFTPIAPPDEIKTYQYNWSDIREKILEQTSWSLIGKVGIRTPEDSMTAAINNWTQVDDFFSIDLSSTFFGLGSSRLLGTSTFLTLLESGEEPISSDQPNELIESALGISLPISYLSYWIKALPTPNHSFELTFNPQGLPASLVQHQWQLRFSQYTLHNDIPLPGKIKLERGDTRITLAIKKWSLPSL